MTFNEWLHRFANEPNFEVGDPIQRHWIRSAYEGGWKDAIEKLKPYLCHADDCALGLGGKCDCGLSELLNVYVDKGR